MSSRRKSYQLRSDCDGECELPDDLEHVHQRRLSVPSASTGSKSTTRRQARSHSADRNELKIRKKKIGRKKKIPGMKKKIHGKKKNIRSYSTKSRSTKNGILRSRSTRGKSNSQQSRKSVSFASPSSRSSNSADPSYQPPSHHSQSSDSVSTSRQSTRSKSTARRSRGSKKSSRPKKRKMKVVKSYRSKRRSMKKGRRRSTSRKATESIRSSSSSGSGSSRKSSSRRRYDSPSQRSDHDSPDSFTLSTKSSTTGVNSFASDDLLELRDLFDDTLQALKEESFLSISKTKSFHPVSSTGTFSPVVDSSSDNHRLLKSLDELNDALLKLQDSDNELFDRTIDVGELDLTNDFCEKIAEDLDQSNYSGQNKTKLILDSELMVKSIAKLSLEEKDGDRLLVVDERVIICSKEIDNDVKMLPQAHQMQMNKHRLDHHFHSNEREVDHSYWTLQTSSRIIFYQRVSKLSLSGGETTNQTVNPALFVAPVTFGTDSGRFFSEDHYYSRRVADGFNRSAVAVFSFNPESRSQDQTEAVRQSIWKTDQSDGHGAPVCREESVELNGKELTLKSRWELKKELWQLPLDWTEKASKDYTLFPDSGQPPNFKDPYQSSAKKNGRKSSDKDSE